MRVRTHTHVYTGVFPSEHEKILAGSALWGGLSTVASSVFPIETSLLLWKPKNGLNPPPTCWFSETLLTLPVPPAALL